MLNCCEVWRQTLRVASVEVWRRTSLSARLPEKAKNTPPTHSCLLGTISMPLSQGTWCHAVGSPNTVYLTFDLLCYLSCRPNEYRKTCGDDEFPFSVAPVPPRADPIPCKPLFFDLVRDELPIPPTRHLAQAASAASSPLHNAGGAAAGGAADDSDDFESVEGSDSDSSDDDSSSDDDADTGAATPAAAATDGTAGGGLLSAARKWFGN